MGGVDGLMATSQEKKKSATVFVKLQTGKYHMNDFKTWFEGAFGLPVPSDYEEFLAENLNGLSAAAGVLWEPEEVMACTEERELEGKGICMIGTTTNLGVFLLRARDGRVIIVDRTDFSDVDAWFSNISACISLLDFS
jgi:hypothetical protein